MPASSKHPSPAQTTLKPGDYIRTGQTGRVLLVRGAESMLISPNSVIHIPKENKDGMSTTIVQRAGTILFDVEKRNVKHFEVDTPYLAAVVKGTQFQVTVDKNESRVDVRRGQVEVLDFKSGQYALVHPGSNGEGLGARIGRPFARRFRDLEPHPAGRPRSSPVDAIAAPEQRSAANGASEPQRSSAESRPGNGVAVLARPENFIDNCRRGRRCVKEDTWASRLTPAANRSGNQNSWWPRTEVMTIDLSFPFAAGLLLPSRSRLSGVGKNESNSRAEPRPTARGRGRSLNTGAT